MTRWIIGLAAFAVFASVGGCGIWRPPLILDLSDFEEFRLDRHEWLDLDVAPDTVYSATIRRDLEGRYSVELAIVDSVSCDFAECPVDTTPGSDLSGHCCPNLSEPSPRELTDDEVAAMHELFAHVTITQSTAGCWPGIYDPGWFTVVSWDERAFDNWPCAWPIIGAQQLADIQGFLESLRTD